MLYTSDRKTLDEVKKSEKFQWSNTIWNHLKLNQRWVVGLTTPLAKDSRFKSVSDFEQYYYDSGAERRRIIFSLSVSKQNILTDYMLHVKEPELIKGLSEGERKLNSGYGRTQAELHEIARYMHYQIEREGNPLGITLEEARLHVIARVVYETAIGIERERRTAAALRRMFPSLSLCDVSGEIDSEYAVDYEAYQNGGLVLAIQIKPVSYRKAMTDIIEETKAFNKKKNDNYTERFGVPVVYVFSKTDGEIMNKEGLDEIRFYIGKAAS